MTATEILTAFAREVAAELPKVRAENKTLAQATALVRSTGAMSIEEAFYVEAKRRVIRRAA